MINKLYKLREFLEILFRHRTIIRDLERKVEYTEKNAADVINLIGKEKYRMVVSRNEKSFDNTIMLTDTEVNTYIKSELLIPPKYKIEKMIFEMKKFKKKERKNDENNKNHN
ncbi:hypothetical protein CVT91_00065 [Candidatus Atribacteria bacterium HGW-Atribacteria-1]|nr:MAG: hypothetical protein CVT91_00065 [Candidatus Atribacteria bacterium HGW-Atribacteria-1]